MDISAEDLGRRLAAFGYGVAPSGAYLAGEDIGIAGVAYEAFALQPLEGGQVLVAHEDDEAGSLALLEGQPRADEGVLARLALNDDPSRTVVLPDEVLGCQLTAITQAFTGERATTVYVTPPDGADPAALTTADVVAPAGTTVAGVQPNGGLVAIALVPEEPDRLHFNRLLARAGLDEFCA